jgi:hypothetical protein
VLPFSDSGNLKQKDRPKAVYMSLMRRACDQAKRIVLFFRRYAIQPSPRKPKIIIAHVEGSGTGAATWRTRKLPTCGSKYDVLAWPSGTKRSVSHDAPL